MKIGQKSFIVFVSRFGSSIIGFVAMVYFARLLGSGVLGLYFLTVAVVSWLKTGSIMGIRLAIRKRISEQKEKHSYAVASFLLILITFLVIAFGVVIFRNQVNQYLGESLYQYVLLLLGAHVVYSYVGSLIVGENLTHLDGSLTLVNTISRVTVQLILISLGLGVIGLLLGEAAGLVIISVVGTIAMATYFDRDIRLEVPKKRHFMSLINYAKFSWLGTVRGKTYNLMDTAVLGFFVSNSLIGIYSICWNISAVLTLFSKSLLTVFFPEMSKLSSQGNREKVSSHIEDSLAYTGLLTIPGLIGAIVVGESVLNIYGAEFQRGYVILIILVSAALVQSYQLQFINTMDALDRPELSFRVNFLFIVSNVTLNFTLVYLYGWIGAAFATLLSTLLALVFSYRLISNIIAFSIPFTQILYQVVSGIIMGLSVQLLVTGLSVLGINTDRFVLVLASVGFGALLYFVVLSVMSSRFRDTVIANLPVEIVPSWI